MILVLQIALVILAFITHTNALPKQRDDEGRQSGQLDSNDLKSQKPMQLLLPSPSMKEPFEPNSTKGLTGRKRQSEDVKTVTTENKEATLTAYTDYGSVVAIQPTVDAHEHRIIKRGVKGYGNSPAQERRTYPPRWSTVGGSTKNVGQYGKGTSSASQTSGTGSLSNIKGLNPDSAYDRRPEGMEVYPNGNVAGQSSYDRGTQVEIFSLVFEEIKPISQKYGYRNVLNAFCSIGLENKVGHGSGSVTGLSRTGSKEDTDTNPDQILPDRNSQCPSCPLCFSTDNTEEKLDISVTSRCPDHCQRN